MIRCRVCDREHEAATKTCVCGADLAIEGVAIGTDARFGDADFGDALPDLGDLPDLDSSFSDFPVDNSLTDSLSIPSVDDAPAPPPVATPTPVADQTPATEPPTTEPVVTSPTAKARANRRHDFAVKPTEGSGDTSKGSARSAPIPLDEPAVLTTVPTAPLVDDDADSVFADAEWDGAGALRDELAIARAGGMITCPTCGREVTADSRFCRCGHQFEFAVRTAVELPPEPSKLTSFWRRISGTAKTNKGDARSWGQRARDTGSRRGMRYAQRLSGGTRVGRVGLLVAGGASMIVILGPLRQQVKDLPDLFDAQQPQQIERWSPGECDAAALDVPGNPWQSRWPADAATTADGECPGVFDTISGSFPNPVDIDRMTIEIGDTSGQSDVNARQPVMSPAGVTIEFTRQGESEPTSPQSLDLADTAIIQEFGVDVRGATGFTLTIVDLHDHSWTELELVQIAQIAFFDE